MDKKHVFLFNGKGWFLMIDSLGELNKYHKMIWAIRKEDFFDDLRREREGKHPTSDLANLCQITARLKGKDSYAEFERLQRIQHEQMSRMILDGHTLYVNPAGGYTPHMENVMNHYESENLQWPVFREDDIRIKQWPGGTHYYAYIGEVQVKDGDTLKWESESDARMAAMAYVSTKKRLK